MIYYLIGFVRDYITEGLGQNPKFTLCRQSHVVLILKNILIIQDFALIFCEANYKRIIRILQSARIIFATKVQY